MPLGQGIGEMWEALRDRVEVSGAGPTWEVTAGCFDTALAYAKERFENPVVLRRQDRARLWRRVTLTVTTDPSRAHTAPPLEELTGPVSRRPPLPASLEAIFVHQEELRAARRRETEA